jgi:hypothetical protein
VIDQVNASSDSWFQVENEYGSFPACDKLYLTYLEMLFRNILGPNVILFTVDGAGVGYLKCGTTDSLYSTVDFGPGVCPQLNVCCLYDLCCPIYPHVIPCI